MDQNLLDFPLKLLNMLGLLVPSTIKSKIILTVVQLVYLFAISAVALQYFYVKLDIFAIIDNTVPFVGFIMMYIKVLHVIVNEKKYFNLVRLTRSFWSSCECSEDTKQEVHSILAKVVFFQKLLAWTAWLWTSFSLVATILLDKPLPIGTWQMPLPDYSKLYKLVYVIYTVTLYLAGCIGGGFDGLFLGFFYQTITQIKIFGDHLQRMDVENIQTDEDLINQFGRFKKYIEHHKFLIAFIKQLQKCYSIIFMTQLASTTPSLCSAFYATFESQSYSAFSQYLVTSIFQIIQVSFYCVAADYLTHEVVTVSDAIYSSNWYSKHFKALKQSTLLMIQQSQQEVHFTACGLMNMNIATVLSIIKLAFSTSTFLRSLD